LDREHPPVKLFLDLSQQAMVDGSSKRASEGWPAQKQKDSKRSGNLFMWRQFNSKPLFKYHVKLPVVLKA
jgi:hypothetical protein